MTAKGKQGPMEYSVVDIDYEGKNCPNWQQSVNRVPWSTLWWKLTMKGNMGFMEYSMVESDHKWIGVIRRVPRSRYSKVEKGS